MTYLDRPSPPKGPPWAHNSFGASVHNALAGWWRLAIEDRIVPAGGKLLERGWISEGYADDAQLARQLSRAKLMVERYVATLDPSAEPAGVERTVATKTDLIAVSGRIDRLDDRVAVGNEGAAGWATLAGRKLPAGADASADRESLSGLEPVQAGIPGADRDLVVVDYKTGRMPLTSQDARSSLALALYALAAGRVLRRRCTIVELHHLPTEQVLRWEHTPESLDRQLRRAEDIAGECATADERFRLDPADSGRGDEVFPPTPGPGCGWCDFRAQCPQGQQASPPRRPWDGLGEHEAFLVAPVAPGQPGPGQAAALAKGTFVAERDG
jgi:hypothetical protein